MEEISTSKPSIPENSALEVDNVVDELRVLAIDAQVFSLQFLCAVLHKCNYKVKAASSAVEALEMLKANKDEFDIVLVDVDSASMDGFKLLEIIGLEMYSPAIMVTADGSLDNLKKGLIHGAVDYILKPVGVQEIKTSIRQTVALNRARTQSDDASCSVQKKKRLIWTQELDEKFMKAVHQLSNGSMVHPKRILQIMNEPGLTRENVASHLQKYRVSLKKQEAEKNEQGLSSSCISNRRKWDINSDHGSSSFKDINSNFLTMLSPCLDSTNSYQSLLCRNLIAPNLQMQDFKSFGHLNYCSHRNIQPHVLGSAYVHDSGSSSGSGHGITATAPFYPYSNRALQQSTSAVASDVPTLFPGSTELTRNNSETDLVSNAAMNSYNDQISHHTNNIIETDDNQQEAEDLISEWLRVDGDLC